MLNPLPVWMIENCGKFSNRMEYQPTLTCLLRNLYAGQEATVRTGHGTTDWFQREKEVHQGCILSPCLFNLHEKCSRQNARLEESQVEIKIAGRNINNLIYAEYIMQNSGLNDAGAGTNSSGRNINNLR